MNNFVFQNPTKLIFGKGQISRLANELPKGGKILVTFGGGSVKKNGVYQQVLAALEGFDYTEFWGIEPNPKVETLRKAVEICKTEGVEFILAVGGGSTLDGTKLIAAAAKIEEDAGAGAQPQTLWRYAPLCKCDDPPRNGLRDEPRCCDLQPRNG